MSNKLFVGSLPYSTTSEDLQQLFGGKGTVTSAQVITDRDSGRSRGFGFVEMSSEDEAAACVKELNGTELEGRRITVSIARPKSNES